MAISLIKSLLSRLVSAKTGIGNRATIILSSDSGRVILPITPAQLPEVSCPQNNETFSSINYDMSVVGSLGLRSLSLECLVPSDALKYSFTNKIGSTADDVLQFLDAVQRNQEHMRIVITYDNGTVYLNMACLLNNFTYTVDKVGDYKLKMDFTEYRIVNALGGVNS